MSDSRPFKSTISITLPSEKQANIIFAVLDVDEELAPEKMIRTYTVEGSVLKVLFEAADPKLLRVGVSSFADMATVAMKTILEFDESI